MRTLILVALLFSPSRAEDVAAPQADSPFSSSKLPLSDRERAAAAGRGWVPSEDGYADSKGRPITWRKMSSLIKKETSRELSELKEKHRQGTISEQDIERARMLFHSRVSFFPDEQKRERIGQFLETITGQRPPRSIPDVGATSTTDSESDPPVIGGGDSSGKNNSPWDSYGPSSGSGSTSAAAPPVPAPEAAAGETKADTGASGGGGSGGGSSDWGCGGNASSPAPASPAPAPAPKLSYFPGIWAIAAAPALIEILRRRRKRAS